MSVLYLLSTDRGDFENSLRLLDAALDYWIPPAVRFAPVDQRLLLQVNVVLRNFASVVGYGVLVVLMVRAFQYGQARLKVVSAAAAFVLSAGYAVAEMLHRREVPTRHGTLDDVRLNLIGIAFFLVGTLLFFGLKHVERRLAQED